MKMHLQVGIDRRTLLTLEGCDRKCKILHMCHPGSHRGTSCM